MFLPRLPDKRSGAGTRGTEIDGVVAIVNGAVILESDVDEERRFEAIQPYRGSSADFSRDRAVQRLIDRTLILQQAKLEADQIQVSKEELDKQIETLRRDIPAWPATVSLRDRRWMEAISRCEWI